MPCAPPSASTSAASVARCIGVGSASHSIRAPPLSPSFGLVCIAECSLGECAPLDEMVMARMATASGCTGSAASSPLPPPPLLPLSSLAGVELERERSITARQADQRRNNAFEWRV